MKLLELTLENFKGVQKFTFTPNGDNCKIYGANGAGKTTLADAYFWLLFGKDSNNNANFSVKTNGTSGLNYSVTGSFQLDSGQTVTLSRTLKEKWERKRGEAEHKLTGNTTDYQINGIPKKQKEYKEFVDSLCTENIFALLTNPDTFASKLHWNERRTLLVNAFAKDVNDSEVISNHSELAELGEELNRGLSVLDFNAEVKTHRDNINRRLKELPIEKNAYNNTITELESVSGKYNEAQLNFLIGQKAGYEERLRMLRTTEHISDIRARLAQAKTKIAEQQTLYIAHHNSDNDSINAEIVNLNKQLIQTQGDISDNEYAIERNQQKRKQLIDRGKQLNAKHKTVKDSEYNGDTICPCCKQLLPSEQVAEAKALFNKDKSTKIEEIWNECQVIKGEIKALDEDTAKREELITESKTKASVLKNRIDELKTNLVTVAPFESTEEYSLLALDVENLKAQLEKTQQNSDEEIASVKAELREVEVKIEKQRQLKANETSLEYNRRKIEECDKEQRRLSKLLADCDRKLELIKQFTRFKATDIEEKINSKFMLVKWKLFKEQVNGGLEDCCEATVDGIAYNDGLNNASKVNAGLDIINVLSEIYSKNVPVWIDNAESVTSYIEGQQQRIYLYVSENHSTLKVEKE